MTLEGKQIYREVCELKSGWDAPLNKSLQQRWKKWEKEMSGEYQVPRAIVGYREEIDSVELHAFSDASTKELERRYIPWFGNRRVPPSN